MYYGVPDVGFYPRGTIEPLSVMQNAVTPCCLVNCAHKPVCRERSPARRPCDTMSRLKLSVRHLSALPLSRNMIQISESYQSTFCCGICSNAEAI